MRYVLIASLALLAASCNKDTNTTATKYHEDGRAKPIVAVPTMIDTTSFDVPWSLADELTSLVIKNIGGQEKIFVQSTEDMALADNPFGSDLSWMKQEFDRQEFAVFLELIEHELTPAKKEKNTAPQETSMNLNMAIRLRVVDLRGASPKVVLQELVRDSYYIPKTLFPTDYSVTIWGSKAYKESPMGIAHGQLMENISQRASDYILLAKSR
jgi:hypothetical protein